jgi:hypothetical protein
VVTLPKITSADSASATVGKTFQFTVTTTGTPVPSIKKSGKLPSGVTLKNDKNGTATISGTPKKAGTYTFTITATFGKNATKYVANQSFTLTVNAA